MAITKKELYDSPVYGNGSMGSFSYALPKGSWTVSNPTRQLTSSRVDLIPETHDVTLPQSQYGMVIPFLYGDLEVAGNIIHVSPDFYKRADGKWAISFLVCFGAPLVPSNSRELRTVKADGQVIYDASPTTPYVQPGISIIFLRGGPGQESLSDVFGGDVPAYRNRICVLFKDFPVQDFSGRVPAMTARIVETPTVGVSSFVYERTNPSNSGAAQAIPAIDYDASMAWLPSEGAGTKLLRGFRIDTRQEIVNAPITGALGGSSLGEFEPNIWHWHAPTQKIITFGKRDLDNPGGVQGPHPMVIDPANARIVAQTPGRRPGFGYKLNTMSIMPSTRGDYLCFAVEQTSGDAFVMRWAPSDDWPPDAGLPTLKAIWSSSGFLAGGRPFSTPGGFDGRYSTVYASGGAATGDIYKIVLANPRQVITWNADGTPNYTSTALDGPVLISKTLIASVGSQIQNIYFDQRRQRLFAWTSDAKLHVLTAAGTVLRTADTPYAYPATGSIGRDLNNSRLDADLFLYNPTGTTNRIYVTDLTTGETQTFTGGTGAANFSTFDSYSRAVYHSGYTGGAFVENRAGSVNGNRVPLSTLLTELAARSGYAPTDIVVENIGDTIVGAFLREDVTYIDLLRHLSQAFGFDIVESGGKIKFRRAATDASLTVAATIPESKLAVLESESGIVVREHWINDRELPRQVEVHHYDPAIGFDYSKQYARRPAEPIAVSYAQDTEAIRVPIVMDASQAARLAAERLYRMWEGQVTQEWATGAEFSWLEAGDVVALQTKGFNWTVHVRSATLSGDDFSQQFSSVNFLAEVAANITSASSLSVWTAPAVGAPASRYIHLDLPLLEAGDDQGGRGLVQYGLTAPRGGGSWQGGRSYVSYDGETYHLVDEQDTAPCVGVTSGTLAAPASPWRVDETNKITVSLISGKASAFETVSDDEFIALVNRVAVGVPGRWEVIAFQTAEVQANGSVVLFNLIRGLHGSEVHAGSHAAGDTVVLIDAEIGAKEYPLALYSAVLPYRAAGKLQPLEYVPDVNHIITGTAERPYAPVHLRAALAGGDITLSWQRRTRVGGEWRDGTETVPLAEASERYDVEILNGSAVVRTFTDLPAPSATYAGADLAADFGGTAPGSLKWRVFQKSAVVGRGYGTQTTSIL
jgi:hypothetical protein